MHNPPDDVLDESPPGAAHRPEPLACSSCRSRKLKCDRLTPACTRCAKAKNECVYPESRRKPAFKRKNVRELETRLAKLEGLLKDASSSSSSNSNAKPAVKPPVDPVEQMAGIEPQAANSPDVPEKGTMWCGGDFDLGESFMTNLLNGDMPPVNFPPQEDPLATPLDGGLGSFSAGELMGLGQFESLPPFEMIEELHQTFFVRQSHSIPIVHKGKYLQAFHSAPHMRPPMCLQYAIWTMAAIGHEKYGGYHDIFYQRTRQYLEADELKGYGEHFLTISHLQAWALTATAEARRMFFTRAGLSSARCVRLIHMMGLHRLDDDSSETRLMTPTLGPPQSWVELEERRRCFWGVFCIDSHASISTGWPNLIDVNEVTTRLPCCEEAFNSGREEKTPTLDQSLRGAEYSSFAGAIVVCHIFNQILRHIHRPTPDDRPEDVNNGPFWKRHRDIDNVLSSAFMFLPERFRLPKNIRDPVALHSNLNLHAAVICLHNAACDKVDKLTLPAHLKRMCQDRALTAAQEITNIMKLSSHVFSTYRSPMVSLSLYCAASTYVHQAKDNDGRCEVENLEFIINCMVAIGKEHLITRAYLQQTLLDIERNGVSISLNIDPGEKVHRNTCFHNIPLLARSSISNHSDIQSVLPGRLPLGRSRTEVPISHNNWRSVPTTSATTNYSTPDGITTTSPEDDDLATVPGSKRKRYSPTTSAAAAAAPSRSQGYPPVSTASTTSSSSSGPSFFGIGPVGGIARLPHRTGSPAPLSTTTTATTASPSSSNPPAARRQIPTTGPLPSNQGATMAAGASPGIPATMQQDDGGHQAPDMNVLRMFQIMDEQWNITELGSMYEHVTELARKGPDVDDGSAVDEAWAFLTGDGGKPWEGEG